MSHIQIDGRCIGPNFPPYVIAEISANHNGDLCQALKLIDAAQEAGADAVKLQTYRPDTITLKSDGPDFQISEGLWAGRTLYDLYEWAHTPWEWHQALFSHAATRGITLFSSPFDFTAADLLSDLQAPAFKIASFEAIDLPLIRYVAAKGRPMIISTGMANLKEITEAVEAALSGGCSELALLHCVSGYPAPPSDYNLVTLKDLAANFGVTVGLSDHTLDNTTAIASVVLGASIIEKHVTLDRTGGGPDDSFSLEPAEFKALCDGVFTAWQALGDIDYGRKSSEQGNAKFRRSLYAVDDIKMGDQITACNIRSIRPGYGLAPRHYEEVLGRHALRDIAYGEPLDWKALSEKRNEEQGE